MSNFLCLSIPGGRLCCAHRTQSKVRRVSTRCHGLHQGGEEGAIGDVDESIVSDAVLSSSRSIFKERRHLMRLAALSQLVGLVPAALAQGEAASLHMYKHRDAKMVMRALALRGSVPQQWVSDFKTAFEGYGFVSLSFKTELADVWKELEGQGKSRKRTTVDAVSIGDSWLQLAILKGLIQPIDNVERYRYWDALSPRWRRVIQRSSDGRIDSNGFAWGIPYRWGCTLILYRHDRKRRWGGKPIADWNDLLLPGLERRIALMDDPREIIGIVLKTLGMGYNASSADLAACGITEEELSERMRHLMSQTRVISNKDHVRAYAAGDVDVIVGNSDDLLPLAQKSSHSTLIAPASGTSLWADLWCIPSTAAGGATDGEPSPLLPAWFELGLQPIRARPNTGLQQGASPLLLPTISGQVKRRQRCDPLLNTSNGSYFSVRARDLPPEPVLQKSEFLEPLDSITLDLFRNVLSI